MGTTRFFFFLQMSWIIGLTKRFNQNKLGGREVWYFQEYPPALQIHFKYLVRTICPSHLKEYFSRGNEIAIFYQKNTTFMGIYANFIMDIPKKNLLNMADKLVHIRDLSKKMEYIWTFFRIIPLPYC